MEQITLTLTPQESADEHQIRKAVAQTLHLPFGAIHSVRIIRKSVDARQRNLKVLLTVQVFMNAEEAQLPPYEKPHYQDVHNAERQVIIVGCGPAGLFAALTLLEHGIRPIIIERGKDVSSRKKDIAQLNRNNGMAADSNYCFGEGGAGTFSDGKLFSRSKKRGNMQRVMELFHYHGATDAVLYETHAHIGSDKLPQIIRDMRETIIKHGGEVLFQERMEAPLLSQAPQPPKSDTPKSRGFFGDPVGGGRRIVGIRTASGKEIMGEAVILAIGHSAHDTYQMLQDAGVRLEPKGFAIGVRAEHPQALIDRLMYRCLSDSDTQTLSNLEIITAIGHASYSLVTQVDGRGVYSFCMCPGGHMVPAGSYEQSCVVNGMSASHRNSPYANSGIVVEIRPEDLATAEELQRDPLIGLHFQQQVEQEAFRQAAKQEVANHPQGDNYSLSIINYQLSKAPAQRLKDFVEGKPSKDLPACSYLPGVVPSRLDQWLPPMIGKRLQQGFRDFDKKYRGYLTNDAVILGVESRSSSAVRIPRDRETLQHPDIANLYPCGEGAGYAGGITSSALDGINAALQIVDRN